MLFLNYLLLLREDNKSKIMISTCLFITSEQRKNALIYLGLDTENKLQYDAIEPIIWLRSAKLPSDRECLTDKGFKNIERLFSHFNRFRYSRILRNINANQCDVMHNC